MELGPFNFHRRAVTAFHELPLEDRAKVEGRLAGLAGPPRQWPVSWVRRLSSLPDLYLVRIDPSLRAIVRAAEGNGPEVLDLVREETLETFAKAGT